MAVKTITIDMDAYERLAREKRPGESFSRVIRRVLGNRKMTARRLLDALDRFALTEETLDRVEDVVRAREREFAQPPDIGAP